MRRTLILILALVLATFSAGAQEPPQGFQHSDPDVVVELMEGRLAIQQFVPGEILVKPRAGVEALGTIQAMSVRSEVRLTSGGELLLRLGGERFVAMSAEEQVDSTLAVVEELRRLPEIEYAQPNYLLQIQLSPNDPLYSGQWHYFDVDGSAPSADDGGIGLPRVWDHIQGDPGVVVAVIDTGIVGEHPDFRPAPRFLPGFDMISDPFRAADGDGRDADPTDAGDDLARGQCGSDRFGQPIPPRALPASWHGSHVAGIVGIGSTGNAIGTAGISWRGGVLPVRVLGKCGGTIADIADAIRWSVGLPVPGLALNEHPAQVLNLSLGGRGSCDEVPVLREAIGDAIEAGATVVVAAGNEADDATGYAPASCPGVIAVAASDRRGRLASRYSNYGPAIDLMAPGGDVRRDDDHDGRPDGVLSYVKGSYDLYNGTSMATPHVAGVAALLKGHRPELVPHQIEAILKNHARARTPEQCPQPCGAGLLDAGFLVGLAIADSPSSTSDGAPAGASER